MEMKGYQMVVDAINKQNFNPNKVYATLVSNGELYAIDCIAGTTVTMHMLSTGNGYGIHSDSVVIHVYNNGTIVIEFSYGDQEL
jgi:hypothetical protein